MMRTINVSSPEAVEEVGERDMELGETSDTSILCQYSTIKNEIGTFRCSSYLVIIPSK